MYTQDYLVNGFKNLMQGESFKLKDSQEKTDCCCLVYDCYFEAVFQLTKEKNEHLLKEMQPFIDKVTPFFLCLKEGFYPKKIPVRLTEYLIEVLGSQNEKISYREFHRFKEKFPLKFFKVPSSPVYESFKSEFLSRENREKLKEHDRLAQNNVVVKYYPDTERHHPLIKNRCFQQRMLDLIKNFF